MRGMTGNHLVEQVLQLRTIAPPSLDGVARIIEAVCSVRAQSLVNGIRMNAESSLDQVEPSDK